MSAGARGAAGSAYVRARVCQVEHDRLREMQSHMNAIAELPLRCYMGARSGGKRDAEIARLLHEYMRVQWAKCRRPEPS